jgi:hypothetical protein
MQRRLTIDEESHLRAAWSVLQKITKPWEEISMLQRAIWEMVANSTTDGRPYVEPPLTDEDARQRPWVMIRAGENFPWTGPATLVDCLQANKAKFLVVWPDKKSWSSCMFARRATAEEIAAAGLDPPDA